MHTYIHIHTHTHTHKHTCTHTHKHSYMHTTYTNIYILTEVVAKVEREKAALHTDKPILICVYTNKY